MAAALRHLPPPTYDPPPGPIRFVPSAPPDDAAKIEAAAKMIGYALSARALLLVALLGAFALGIFVMMTPDVIRLLALVAYCVLSVGPVTYLERMKGR